MMYGEHVNDIWGDIVGELNKCKHKYRSENNKVLWCDADLMVAGCDKIMQCLVMRLRYIARDMEIKVDDYFECGDKEEARRLAKRAFA